MSSERGAILIQVGVILVFLMAFTGFVADQGLLFVSRRQAQNAADAGAHAGAVALAFDADDRSPDGPAKTSAYRVATTNTVAGEAPSVINPAGGDDTDVKFYSDDPTAFPPECDDDFCIRVDVYRNQERNNPLPVWFTQLIGVENQGVRATAIARAEPASFSDCLKPWIIPDKFVDNNGNGEFDIGVDVYSSPGWTTADIGTVLTLKEGNPGQGGDPVSPSFFFRWGPANTYQEAIETCLYEAGILDTIGVRPGAGVGPTRHGVENLTANGPVTIVVPMYNPAAFAAMDRQSGNFDLTIVNMMGFRLEGYGPGNNVTGTIVAAPGLTTGEEDEETAGELLRAVQLIR